MSTSESSASVNFAPEPADQPSPTLKAKWAIYELGDLRQRCEEIDSGQSLINDLIPVRSLTIVVGDSGLGKSPLLYQAGLCVASGQPFLGLETRKGRVLYMDGENGLGDVDETARRISRHLGLGWPVPDFYCWNLNDCAANWQTAGHGPRELLRDLKPDLVIIDPVAALWPDVQGQNTDAAKTLKELRAIMSETGCAIILVHHTKKSGEQPLASIADGPDLRRWFENARGPRAIINGTDVRLAVDLPGVASHNDADLVIGGFGRVRGPIPLVNVARVMDADGEPLGYSRLTGLALLPKDQQAPFDRLPPHFRFTEAKKIYGKGSQATKDWLSKCRTAGILIKEGSGYRKLQQTPELLAA